MTKRAAIDEFPIREIPDTALWSENYAMLIGDPRNNVAVYFSCGRWLDEPTIWREVISVVLGNERVLVAKNYGRGATDKGPGGSLASLEVVEPEHTLRLRFKGPVIATTDELLLTHGFRDSAKSLGVIDLTFEGASPVWNMKGDSVEASTIAGSLHIEQIGAVSGTITHGGKTYTLDNAYAVRDHSRGIRDVSSYRYHCWLNGRLGPERFFFLYGMQLQGSGELGMSNAAIFDRGKLYPAKLVDHDVLADQQDHLRPRTIVLDSELGKMKIRTTQILTNFASSMISPYDMSPGWTQYDRSAHMVDQLATFDCNGEPATGWVEQGFAPQPLV
jgi:hypothetical protein